MAKDTDHNIDRPRTCVSADSCNFTFYLLYINLAIIGDHNRRRPLRISNSLEFLLEGEHISPSHRNENGSDLS